MFKLAASKISIFLASLCREETGLSVALSKTPKTGFVALRPMFSICQYEAFRTKYSADFKQ